MSLFTPDSGLLFWMLLSFGVVFFVLAKYGFPAITRMVDERKQYIDQSLEKAHEANRRLAEIQKESELILKQAKEEQAKILKTAHATREQIIDEARQKAQQESVRLIEDARMQIQQEKEHALDEIKHQTAALSIQMAEMIMRQKLDHPAEQTALIERLIDEADKTDQ